MSREELDAKLSREQRVICRLVEKHGIASYVQVAQAYINNDSLLLAEWKSSLKLSQEQRKKTV